MEKVPRQTSLTLSLSLAFLTLGVSIVGLIASSNRILGIAAGISLLAGCVSASIAGERETAKKTKSLEFLLTELQSFTPELLETLPLEVQSKITDLEIALENSQKTEKMFDTKEQ